MKCQICVLMYCKLIYIHDSPVIITRARNNTPEKPWKAWKYWLFALLKGGKKKKKKRTCPRFIKFKKPITKILVTEAAVGENYKADFFIFSEKWNWVSQGRGISIFLNVYLFFPIHPCRRQSVWGKKKQKETDMERGREQEGQWKKKDVNKSLLVSKILY